MNNPFAQVALTYYRRLFSPFWVGLMVLGAFCMILLPIIGASLTHQLWDSVLFNFFFQGFTMLFFFMPIHIKEQFADSRANLLPSFRKAHIAVAGAIAFVVAVLMPTVVSILLGLHSIGLVAFMLFWLGLLSLATLFQKNWQMWFILVGFFAGLYWGGIFLEEWCSGKYELPALGLLALGLAIIVFCGIRLCRLNEDMPEFHLRIFRKAWSGKSQNWPGMPYSPGGLRDRLWASHMAGMIRYAQRSPGSPWSRICRWQIGMQTGWTIPCLAGVFPLMFFLPYYVLTTKLHPNPLQTHFPIAMMVIMCTIMSAASTWGILWRRRTQSMQYEYMLPVSRAAYLKQVGMAAALNLVQLWLGLGIVVVLLQQIFAPQSTALTASVLLYSALCQIGSFGLGIWFLRLRNPILIFSVGMVLIQIIIMPIYFAEGPFNGSMGPRLNVLLWAAVGFAAFGLLASWDGYRRWLVADFG